MVAITGGTGLLGSIILDHFVKKGSLVTATFRIKPPALITHSEPKVKWIEADVRDIHSLTKAFEGASTVVHTAALVSFAPRHKKEMFQINVDGTANVVNACQQAGVKRLVHISSVAALGKTSKQKITNEKAGWPGDERASNYGQSKYLAELEVFRGEAEGLSVALINPSIILAAGNSHRSSGKIFQYLFDEHPFYIAGQINYVDARDVADMAVRLTDNFSMNGRFIANAGAIPWKMLFDQIAARLGKKSPSIKVSPPLAMAMARFERIKCAITGQEPLITKETARVARQHIIYSNKKACQDLAISFRDLNDTLDWCCEGFLDNQRAKV